MTPAAYGTVKAQLKAREEGGWKRVAWALARRPQLHELELVHARLIAANPKVRSPLPSRQHQAEQVKDVLAAHIDCCARLHSSLAPLEVVMTRSRRGTKILR